MATVLLYGHLAKSFGKRHEYNISTPHEALSALRANYPGFESSVRNDETGYSIHVGYEEATVKTLSNPMSQREVIRIVPTVQGAGVEMAIGMWLASVGVNASIAAVLAAVAVNVAIGLVVTGITSLLFSPDKSEVTNSERPENTPGYAFNGPVNTTAQGHPVPVGYGRLRVGSQIISAGLYTEQIPV